MFDFLKRKKEVTPATTADTAVEVISETTTPTTEKQGLFARLKRGLRKTRVNLGSSLSRLFSGKQQLDPETIAELEEVLLLADVGIEVTERLIQAVQKKISAEALATPGGWQSLLQQELIEILKPCEQPLVVDESKMPYVILMVGVNGAGKTTTIGKLAHQFQQQGKKVMLAAGDTFRAAAIEQLKVWGERNQIPVIAQASGSDSASVIFDALQAAKARNIDILIADTAGRLHTQSNLMEELKKVRRVLTKLDASAPHETLLIVDAVTGQNALTQAEKFKNNMGISGLVLTKLDGTAKGGIIFAIADKLQLPIRYIGIGEAIEDLRIFQSEDFVQALLNE